MMKYIISKTRIIGIIIMLVVFVYSCDNNKLKEMPLEKFEGVWRMDGREIFDGMQIKIEENSKGKLTGKVVGLNDNKYVNIFVDINDTWITGIKRTSNYEFVLTEKKIGSELFSLYDLETKKNYKVEFIDENTFGLGSEESNPKETDVKYIRVNIDES